MVFLFRIDVAFESPKDDAQLHAKFSTQTWRLNRFGRQPLGYLSRKRLQFHGRKIEDWILLHQAWRSSAFPTRLN
jgi:hypothetical protein